MLAAVEHGCVTLRGGAEGSRIKGSRDGGIESLKDQSRNREGAVIFHREGPLITGSTR